MITKEQAEYIFKCVAYKEKTYEILEQELKINKTTIVRQMKTFKKFFGLTESEKYCAKTYLKFKYKDEIKNKYLNGESSKAIAEYYGFSYDHMIIEILKDLNVEIRQRGYKSRTNQELFKNITNEVEAYTLGLIFSDGNIGKDYSISITLKESDKDLLNKINEILFNNTGSTLINIKKNNSEQKTYRLLICGKAICNNLKQYGLCPNKSHLLKDFPRFDENLMPHFIRGLYDGDGVCSKSNQYLRVGYCAYNKEFTQNFQQFLVKKLNIKKNKLFDTGNCWDCSWSAKDDLIKIYHYLYDDATIFLSRKKDKLQKYLQGNTEVTF